MEPLTMVAIGSFIAGTASKLSGDSAQRKAARAQRQAAALQEAQSRRDMVRQGRIASEDVIRTAAATGTLDSSRTQQAVGSISQQLGDGLNLSNRLSELGQSASRYLAQASKMNMYSNVFNQVGTSIISR